MTQTGSATRLLAQRPINRYGVLDNTPLCMLVVGQISAKELAQCLGVSVKVASSLNEALCSSTKPAHAIARVGEVDIGFASVHCARCCCLIISGWSSTTSVPLEGAS